MPVGTGAWNQDGVIIFGSFGNSPLRRASAAGGVATDLTALDASHALTAAKRQHVHYGGTELGSLIEEEMTHGFGVCRVTAKLVPGERSN